MLRTKEGVKAFSQKIQKIFPTMNCDQTILFMTDVIAPLIDAIAISSMGAKQHDHGKQLREKAVEEFFTPTVVLEQDKKEPRLFRLAMYADSVELLHEDDDPALVNKHFLEDKLESKSEVLEIVKAFLLDVHGAVIMERNVIHSCTELRLDKLSFGASDSTTIAMVGYMYDALKSAVSDWNKTESTAYVRHQAAAIMLDGLDVGCSIKEESKND